MNGNLNKFGFLLQYKKYEFLWKNGIFFKKYIFSLFLFLYFFVNEREYWVFVSFLKVLKHNFHLFSFFNQFISVFSCFLSAIDRRIYSNWVFFWCDDENEVDFTQLTRFCDYFMNSTFKTIVTSRNF